MTSCTLSLSKALLDWYDGAQRVLPWRVGRGCLKPNAYHVLLSEFLLQQTTVKAVIPYFYRFIDRWPTLKDLAQASLEDVLKVFAGLGYYRRARNLHACVQHIFYQLEGKVPSTYEHLQTLPGIGPYTAAAIASIAFSQPVGVVDGNVLRIVSRLFKIDSPLPALKKKVNQAVNDMTPSLRSGDFAQAMMDLGASICTPKQPQCTLCPLQTYCQAHQMGQPHLFPTKVAKQDKPKREGVCFIALDQEKKQILLCKRPFDGLLGGMTALPCSDLTTSCDIKNLAPPFSASWILLEKPVCHTFTHFTLDLYLKIAHLDTNASVVTFPLFWHPVETVFHQALPSLMQKALKLALPNLRYTQ